MAGRPIVAETKDDKLAKFLLSNPQKNTSMLFMWLTVNGAQCVWMIVDGAFNK